MSHGKFHLACTLLKDSTGNDTEVNARCSSTALDGNAVLAMIVGTWSPVMTKGVISVASYEMPSAFGKRVGALFCGIRESR